MIHFSGPSDEIPWWCPFYKGKGCRKECKNYTGITTRSVPVKVFALVLLHRVKDKLLLIWRHEQSGFTPVDRISTLSNIIQTRKEFNRPSWIAYVDLKSAFDSVDHQSLWLLLMSTGLLNLMEVLYMDTFSCVRLCHLRLVQGQLWCLPRLQHCTRFICGANELNPGTYSIGFRWYHSWWEGIHWLGLCRQRGPSRSDAVSAASVTERDEGRGETAGTAHQLVENKDSANWWTTLQPVTSDSGRRECEHRGLICLSWTGRNKATMKSAAVLKSPEGAWLRSISTCEDQQSHLTQRSGSTGPTSFQSCSMVRRPTWKTTKELCQGTDSFDWWWRSSAFLTQSKWQMRRSGKCKKHNASQSPTWCELADCASSATLHKRKQPNFIVVLYGLQCRSHHHLGSDPREGQARHGYEWSRTTSIWWTERNGVASWAKQRSTRSRLWREEGDDPCSSSQSKPMMSDSASLATTRYVRPVR